MDRKPLNVLEDIMSRFPRLVRRSVCWLVRGEPGPTSIRHFSVNRGAKETLWLWERLAVQKKLTLSRLECSRLSGWWPLRGIMLM